MGYSCCTGGIGVRKIYLVIAVVVAGIVVGRLLIGMGQGPERGEQRIENIESVLMNHRAIGETSIYHWWTAGGEKQALDAALRGFKQMYPSVEVKDVGIAGGAGGGMVVKIKTQVIAGNAPESFQAHPGYEIEPYFEAGALLELDELWRYAGLESRTPDMIRRLSRTGGHYYVVPIGVHKSNSVWYNKSIFEKLGVSPPKEPVSFEEFWELCDRLKSEMPPRTYPLGLGDRGDWPATHVFETIMAGMSIQTYEDFINGEVRESQLEPVLRKFKKFLEYVPKDHRARTWSEAAGLMFAGRVAMIVNGDWVKGYFRQRGWTYGDQYGSFSFPGTSDKFGLVMDCFVAPKNVRWPKNTLRWLYSYTNTEVQEKFNPLKGSVSPYENTPLEIYDDYSRACAKQVYDPTTSFYPSIAHGTGSPWRVLIDLHRKISMFAVDPKGVSASDIADLVSEVEHTRRWKITR